VRDLASHGDEHGGGHLPPQHQLFQRHGQGQGVGNPLDGLLDADACDLVRIYKLRLLLLLWMEWLQRSLGAGPGVAGQLRRFGGRRRRRCIRRCIRRRRHHHHHRQAVPHGHGME
jgi:hypothetical protein